MGLRFSRKSRCGRLWIAAASSGPGANRTRHCVARWQVAILRLPVGVRLCERSRVPCNVRRLPPIVCRSLVLLTRSVRLPAPTSLAQRASLLAAEPVVTTRRSPVPTTGYAAPTQVVPASDGLPGASHRTTAQCGSSLCLFLNRCRFIARAIRAPLSLGSWLNSMDRLPTGSTIEAKSGCSRGQQQKHCTQREWCPRRPL
jgi:hypothetical protein